MVQNCPKWFIVQNDPKLSKDPKWLTMVYNGPIWANMFHN